MENQTPSLPKSLVHILDQPAHLAEVRLDRHANLSFRLFAADHQQLQELSGQLDWPPKLTTLAAQITSQLDLVPGTWIRFRDEDFALNFEIPPHNPYPITTLRVFLRKMGATIPNDLEKALQPALTQKGARWGLTMDLEKGPSLFTRVPRTLLETWPEELISHKLADPTALPLTRRCLAMQAAPDCYVSLLPFAVDLEQVPLQHLGLPLQAWPPTPEPLVCPYAKCTADGWQAYLDWPAYAAWWKPAHSRAAETPRDFLQRVAQYYDRAQSLYLDHVGHTWQAGHFGANGPQSSNQEIARRAELNPGQRVLDAGCGVAGPAIDLARAVPGLKIQGVTLCPAQKARGDHEIHSHNLTHAVQVRVEDYHHLSDPDASFDRVLFLESAGYSYDPIALFQEAWRVLRNEGLVYIKDVFRRPGPLSGRQWRELAAFDELYAQRTPTLESTRQALKDAGFSHVEAREVQLDMTHYQHALTTAFAQLHARKFQDLPVFFAELRAHKR